MGLIFVTGVSGAGKSAVAESLREGGWEAHDTDEDGMCVWCERATGRPVDQNQRGDSAEWLDRHDWNIFRSRVEELARRAGDRRVFLCGSPSNYEDVWDLFSTVVCLVVDDETLRTRLAGRTTNDFGKAPHELERVLEWNKDNGEHFRQLGAQIVDASRPLDEVVEEVLRVIT
jgi:broad-specificity NMP kinase